MSVHKTDGSRRYFHRDFLDCGKYLGMDKAFHGANIQVPFLAIVSQCPEKQFGDFGGL